MTLYTFPFVKTKDHGDIAVLLIGSIELKTSSIYNQWTSDFSADMIIQIISNDKIILKEFLLHNFYKILKSSYTTFLYQSLSNTNFESHKVESYCLKWLNESVCYMNPWTYLRKRTWWLCKPSQKCHSYGVCAATCLIKKKTPALLNTGKQLKTSTDLGSISL